MPSFLEQKITKRITPPSDAQLGLHVFPAGVNSRAYPQYAFAMFPQLQSHRHHFSVALNPDYLRAWACADQFTCTGVFPFAVQHSYRGPDGLKAFVCAVYVNTRKPVKMMIGDAGLRRRTI